MGKAARFEGDPKGTVNIAMEDESLLTAFLVDLKDKGHSPWTLDTYRQNLRTFLRWCVNAGIAGPSAVTIEHLKEYLRPQSNLRTRRLHLAGLRQFYGYLRAQGHVSADPTRAVAGDGKLVLPLPRINRRAPRVITADEERVLFAAAETGADLELQVLLRLMRFSGLRVGEVVGHRRALWNPYQRTRTIHEFPGLRICDIDLARGILDVRGKGSSEDLAYLDRQTAALIRQLISTLEHRHPDAPIFQLHDGRPKGTRWAFARFRAFARKAAISRHLTLHMLRHTFATRFLENGGNLRAAQRLMRHRELETTLVYADFVADGALRREFDEHNVDTTRKPEAAGIALNTTRSAVIH